MDIEPVNVEEFEKVARKILAKMNYDYFAAGAEDEHTLRENIEAFQRISLRPRVLVDVSRIDMSTSILGYKTSAPMHYDCSNCFASNGTSPRRDLNSQSSGIMQRHNVTYMSTCTVEEVASSCNAIRFFQLCVFKRRDISALLVKRAERNGFKALLLTVDAPKLGRREADIKNKMIVPQPKNFQGLLSTKVDNHEGSDIEAYASNSFDPSFSWKDIAWLRSITNMPIILKGILTREDAIKALEVGVEGIIVSNHGGRQLNYVPASIAALEEAVHAVQGRIPVFLDGGIRRGTDVFKALALGAQAVLIGRPVLYGLAVKGEEGVRRVITMLKDELELTMAFTGCPTLNDITRNHVKTQSDNNSHYCRL